MKVEEMNRGAKKWETEKLLGASNLGEDGNGLKKKDSLVGEVAEKLRI